ncbi:MAG TPA: prepilin peptidase [Aggregatilineales bacterium]|nr:prepilin peptidase [Anaerolineales bacterium]HRE49580.1 prepilin peptidase [Aggregatilineales bacterium]
MHGFPFALLGFAFGVLLNVLADYLAARRHYQTAKNSPFSTLKPTPPHLRPRWDDGHTAPLYAWSEVVGALRGKTPFHPPRHVRRLAVEVGMAALWWGLAVGYGERPFFPFYLLYSAVFVLCVVSDIEQRWLYDEGLMVGALAAVIEALFVQRLPFQEMLGGGILAALVAYAVYLGGILFGVVLGRRGNAVGRTIFGFGDVKLAAVGGLLLGTNAFGMALLLAGISAGMAALAVIIRRWLSKRKGRRFSAIPYAPHLVLGIALVLYMPDLALTILWTIVSLV